MKSTIKKMNKSGVLTVCLYYNNNIKIISCCFFNINNLTVVKRNLEFQKLLFP